MYQKIHFLFQKATHKQTNTQKIKKQESKKLKETKEEKRISPEKSIKKINLRPPGRRFFSSPAFPETCYF